MHTNKQDMDKNTNKGTARSAARLRRAKKRWTGSRAISLTLGLLLVFSSVPIYAFAAGVGETTAPAASAESQATTAPAAAATASAAAESSSLDGETPSTTPAQGGGDPASGSATEQSANTVQGALVGADASGNLSGSTNATNANNNPVTGDGSSGANNAAAAAASTTPTDPTANLTYQFVDPTNYTTPLLDQNDPTKSQLTTNAQADQTLKVAQRIDYAITPAIPETTLPANSITITVPALFGLDLAPKLLTGQDVEKAKKDLDPNYLIQDPAPLTHFTIKTSDAKKTVLTNTTPINSGKAGLLILTYNLNTSKLAFNTNNQATQTNISAKLEVNGKGISYKTIDDKDPKPLSATVTLQALAPTGEDNPSASTSPLQSLAITPLAKPASAPADAIEVQTTNGKSIWVRLSLPSGGSVVNLQPGQFVTFTLEYWVDYLTESNKLAAGDILELRFADFPTGRFTPPVNQHTSGNTLRDGLLSLRFADVGGNTVNDATQGSLSVTFTASSTSGPGTWVPEVTGKGSADNLITITQIVIPSGNPGPPSPSDGIEVFAKKHEHVLMKNNDTNYPQQFAYSGAYDGIIPDTAEYIQYQLVANYAPGTGGANWLTYHKPFDEITFTDTLGAAQEFVTQEGAPVRTPATTINTDGTPFSGGPFDGDYEGVAPFTAIMVQNHDSTTGLGGGWNKLDTADGLSTGKIILTVSADKKTVSLTVKKGAKFVGWTPGSGLEVNEFSDFSLYYYAKVTDSDAMEYKNSAEVTFKNGGSVEYQHDNATINVVAKGAAHFITKKVGTSITPTNNVDKYTSENPLIIPDGVTTVYYRIEYKVTGEDAAIGTINVVDPLPPELHNAQPVSGWNTSFNDIQVVTDTNGRETVVANNTQVIPHNQSASIWFSADLQKMKPGVAVKNVVGDGAPAVIKKDGFAINIYKESTGENPAALADAEFTLYKFDTNIGDYATYNGETGATFANPLTTDNTGYSAIAALIPGDYQLIETKAPNGYELDATPIKFTVWPNNEGLEITDAADGVKDPVITSTNQTVYATITVPNTPTPDPTGQITITKAWAGNNIPSPLPTTVTVEMYQSADAVQDLSPTDTLLQTITLAAADGWTKTIDNLPLGFYYYIVENPVPTGSDVSYSDSVQLTAASGTIPVPPDLTGAAHVTTLAGLVALTDDSNRQLKGTKIIVIDGDITWSGNPFEIYGDITITASGPYTIANTSGYAFEVRGTGKLTLGYNYTEQLSISNGKGAVNLNAAGAEFIMNGGTLSGHSTSAIEVSNSTTATINAGSIYNNTTTGTYGGGIHTGDNTTSKTIIYNAIILNNTVTSGTGKGGGLYTCPQGDIIIEEGASVIDGNTASNGPDIRADGKYVSGTKSRPTTMLGGAAYVWDETGSDSGGKDLALENKATGITLAAMQSQYPTATFIYNNTAGSYGGGVGGNGEVVIKAGDPSGGGTPGNPSGNLVVTNTYDSQTPPPTPTGELSLTKQSTGGGRNADDEFTFTATFADSTSQGLDFSGLEIAKNSDAATSYTNGAQFTLKDTEFVTFTNIPLAATYQLLETDAQGYTLTWNPESSNTGSIDSTTLVAVTAINYKNATEPPPTPLISVEVDKDTIKRTSAAYISLPGHEGFDNVASQERYKYEFDFRSTSSVPADEFVVDDPLESVRDGYVRVQELWTPIVWGDDAALGSVSDGRFYVLYKIANANSNNISSGMTPGYSNATYSNYGYYLWPSNDADNTGALSTNARHHLSVSDLGLAEDQYVSAIRLDYGPVEVGFTSKNYNDSTSINDEHRSAHHQTPNVSGIEVAQPLQGQSTLPGLIAFSAQLQKLSVFANTELGEQIGALAGSQTSPEIDAQLSTLATGVNQWQPVPGRADYAAGAAAATGLSSAAYVVTATQPMEETPIVSSVVARIAKGALTDFDQDAVRTLEISTFTAGPEAGAYDYADLESTYIDNLIEAGYTMRGGAWYDPQGNLLNPAKVGFPQTGDNKTLFLFIAIMLSELGAVLILAAILSSRKKRVRAAAAGSSGNSGSTANANAAIAANAVAKTALAHKLLPTLLVALMLIPALPGLAIAAPGDPGEDETNITIEYRYTDGEEPSIPPTITQLGRTYRLISQADPVLENTMPQTRTYTYRIDGELSPDDLATVADIPGLTLTPVEEVRERRIDKYGSTHVDINEAEGFMEGGYFEVASATDPSGTTQVWLERAGLRFDEETDADGFPTGYTAHVVFRGVETYSAEAYYLAESSYTTEIPDSELSQYVIVAVYEPLDRPTVVEPIVDDPEPEASVVEMEFSAAEMVQITNQTGNPLVDIANNAVPLGSFNVIGAWSFASLVFAVLAVVISAGIFAAGFLARNQEGASVGNGGNGSSSTASRRKRNPTIKAIAIAFGLVVMVIWLVLDDMNLPMVWINFWTLLMGTLFVLQLALLAFYLFWTKVAPAKLAPQEPVTL